MAVPSAGATFASSSDAAQHVVHAALAPRLAVLASPDVDAALLAPNGLPDFAALLRPFESSIRGLAVRTTELVTRPAPSFPLAFDTLASFAPPRSSRAAPAAAAASASSSSPPPTPAAPTRPAASRAASAASVSARDARAEVLLDALGPVVREAARESAAVDAETTPWFAAMRDAVLAKRRVEPHESFGWPVGVMLVVSSASPDPMNAFANLFEASSPSIARAFADRAFVDPNVLRYYVLVHDVASSGPDFSDSLAILENVKKTYGVHACLLPLNSASSAEPHESGISALWRTALRHPPRSPPPRPPGDAAPPPVPPKEPEDDGPSAGAAAEAEEEPAASDFALLFNDTDVKRLQMFVREFAAQSLVPFLERCTTQWNETLAASRRGLTGRLFGAGRKLFGSSGSSLRGSNGTAAPSFSTLGFFPHTAIEAQTRRLADFAFMTRDYKLAAAMYDILRKDYVQEKAVKYVAGATEMFGLAHLMMMLVTKSAPIDVDSYLASACASYMAAPRTLGSQVQLDGLRATLLYYEAYRALNFYRSAPGALARAAEAGSGENDIEVAGAVLLEQAALADLRQPGRPSLRKHAAHLVLAAHRYRDCGQKELSLRCFRRAADAYAERSIGARGALASPQPQAVGAEEDEDWPETDPARIARERGPRDDELGWQRIEDHLEYELGRQAYADGDASGAVAHFLRLLRPSRLPTDASDEERAARAARHAMHLEELLTAYKYTEQAEKASGDELSLALPHPLFDVAASHVRASSNSGALADDPAWAALETAYLDRAFASESGRPASLARPTANVAAVDETFHVELCIRNPLGTPLTVSQISVAFADLSDEPVELASDAVPDIELSAEEERILSIPARSTKLAKLRCAHVSFRLAGAVPLRQVLDKRGARLNATREQRISSTAMYAEDQSLVVEIREARPELALELLEPPTRLGLGEEASTTLRLTNVGRVPIADLRVLADKPDVLLLGAHDEHEFSSMSNSLRDTEPLRIELPGGVLQAGASVELPARLRGAALGSLEPRCLAVFRGDEATDLQTARLTHGFVVEPVIDLAVQAGAARGEQLSYLLHLEAVNLSAGDDSTHVEAISFVSPHWSADAGQDEALQGALGTMPYYQRQGASLTLSEAAAAQLEASSGAPLRDLSFTAKQLGLLLQGLPLDGQPQDIAVHQSTVGSSSSVSPFFHAARKVWRQAALARHFAAVAPRDRTQAFTLWEPSDVDVVAHWVSGDRRGQAFIFGLQLGPAHDHLPQLAAGEAGRIIYEESAREKAALLTSLLHSRLHVEEDPLVVDVSAAQRATHDFASCRHRLPVHFAVRNLSTVRSVSFVLQLDNTPYERTRGAEVQPAPWLGRLTQRGSLAPRERVQLEAHVAASAPGMWEAGAWTLRVSVALPQPDGADASGDRAVHFEQTGFAGCITAVAQE